MTVLDAIKEVSGRAGKSLTQNLENGESLKVALIRGLNLYNKDFNNRYKWPWRTRTISIQTVGNVTAGSVTVTFGSRTVTGGSGWTSGMAGRFLKLDRDEEFYEILSISSGTLTLSKPYLGASGSNLTYLIWKKYYDLDPEVPFSTTINLSRWPYASEPIDRKDMDSSFQKAYFQGFPEAWALADINRKKVVYNTGTVSISLNGTTLTGVNTAFLDNIFTGTEIVLDKVYNVDSVESDTQATLMQKATTVQAGATYEARTRNRTRIILSSVPSPAINLYVTYPRKQYDLINDADELPMWEGMEHCVVDCLYGYLLEKFTSDDSYNWLKIYRDEVKEAWAAVQEMNPVTGVSRPGRLVPPAGYRRTIYG